METMPPVAGHQEHLYKLAEFCAALRTALLGAGLEPTKVRNIFHGFVAAECIGCGILVSGEELFALSQPPALECASAKTGRMRRGDCAREGCNSFYYLIGFTHHAEVDWPTVLAVTDRLRSDVNSKPQGVTPKPSSWGSLIGWKTIAQSVAFAVALLLLLLLRQFYQGGRIPLLREPEHFQVDVASEGQAEFSTELPTGQPDTR